MKRVINYKPILFSSSMVNAILDGRKTVTRRIFNWGNKTLIKDAVFGYTAFTPPGHISGRGIHKSGEMGESFFPFPYGRVGDRMWVRETFCPNPGRSNFLYRADQIGMVQSNKWKPAIHMPKVACRILLEITDIRVEKLHDITHEDALKEGISFFKDDISTMTLYKDYYSDASGYGHEEHDYPTVATPKESFQSLWCRINGVVSWNINPEVWVISFKRIENTQRCEICDKLVAEDEIEYSGIESEVQLCNECNAKIKAGIENCKGHENDGEDACKHCGMYMGKEL